METRSMVNLKESYGVVRVAAKGMGCSNWHVYNIYRH